MRSAESPQPLSPVLRSRPYLHGVDEFVIALRTGDERGQAIVDALEDLADITLRQVLEGRRYRLIRGDLLSIEGELDRIDPSWREHLRVYREVVPEPH